MSTIGAKIDRLFELREEQRALEKKVDEIKESRNALEQDLLVQMQAEGVSKSTGKCATAAISTSIKPQVEDWDRFYGFIHRHKYFHLLERRPSVTGCRELFETKGKIPGVVPFSVNTIRLNKTGET